MNEMERIENRGYLGGAVMAYQDVADFVRNLHDKCPESGFKVLLKELADGLHLKAQTAKVMVANAKRGIMPIKESE